MQQPPFPTPSEQPKSFEYNSPPQQPGFPPYSSQPPYSPPTPSTKKIALKYGMIFGALLVIRDLIGYVFSYSIPYLQRDFQLTTSNITQLAFLVTAGFTLIDWIIYFLAGFFAARRAHQVNAAVFACLWANLCYGIIYCVLTALSVIYIMYQLTGMNRLLQSYLTSMGLNFAVTLILLHIGLGTAIGALGGLLGKSTAPRQMS